MLKEELGLIQIEINEYNDRLLELDKQRENILKDISLCVRDRDMLIKTRHDLQVRIGRSE